MISISVTHNIDDTIRRLQAQAQQVPYAVAKALTLTARDARQDVMVRMPEAIDRPTPFTLRGIGYTPSTKATLTATVFIRDVQATYLTKLVTGGTVTPKRRALVEPATIRLDRFGNLPRTALARLRGRKDTFSANINGIGGIWQRKGRGVKLLVKFEQTQEKRKQFDFPAMVRESVARRFPLHFERALADAMRTAR
jgi:hypothetical protein